jgi:hypothetical protein
VRPRGRCPVVQHATGMSASMIRPSPRSACPCRWIDNPSYAQRPTSGSALVISELRPISTDFSAACAERWVSAPVKPWPRPRAPCASLSSGRCSLSGSNAQLSGRSSATRASGGPAKSRSERGVHL